MSFPLKLNKMMLSTSRCSLQENRLHIGWSETPQKVCSIVLSITSLLNFIQKYSLCIFLVGLLIFQWPFSFQRNVTIVTDELQVKLSPVEGLVVEEVHCYVKCQFQVDLQESAAFCTLTWMLRWLRPVPDSDTVAMLARVYTSIIVLTSVAIIIILSWANRTCTRWQKRLCYGSALPCLKGLSIQ